jgi:hypothetical protein
MYVRFYLTSDIYATRLCVGLSSLLNRLEGSVYHCVLWYPETRSAPIRQSENIVGTFQERMCRSRQCAHCQ